MNLFRLTMLAAFALGISAVASANAGPGSQRQAEILYLLRHDCGSCHGMRLEGGLGPPLTPPALSRLSNEQIVATILHGRPGTPMPPWRPFLTPEEARWLAGKLRQGVAR